MPAKRKYTTPANAREAWRTSDSIRKGDDTVVDVAVRRTINRVTRAAGGDPKRLNKTRWKGVRM